VFAATKFLSAIYNASSVPGLFFTYSSPNMRGKAYYEYENQGIGRETCGGKFGIGGKRESPS